MPFRSSMLVPPVLVPEETCCFIEACVCLCKFFRAQVEVRLSTAVAASAVRGSLPILTQGTATDCRIPSLSCRLRLTTGGPAPPARPRCAHLPPTTRDG